MIVDLIFITS
jgi:hypothetical protein